MDYSSYPANVVEEIVRLRRLIAEARVPPKAVNQNVLIATWNIRAFGGVFPSFDENPDAPKRNLRGLVHIAEIVRHFDIVAIQEVKRNLTGLRMLLSELGPEWSVLVTDIVRGAEGNTERLAFVFDSTRVELTGLAGELVIPPMEDREPSRQFARTPFAVSFKSADAEFVLVTLHVLYGSVPAQREPELREIARWMADWSSDPERFHDDLIVLGDFNIDRAGDPRFEAFTSTGLFVPEAIRGQRSTIFQTNAKHYDQIAWFQGQMQMSYTGRGGTLDFSDAVFREQTNSQKSYRVSDHVPLWLEFGVDRSVEELGRVLGLTEVELASPDPFARVPA